MFSDVCIFYQRPTREHREAKEKLVSSSSVANTPHMKRLKSSRRSRAKCLWCLVPKISSRGKPERSRLLVSPVLEQINAQITTSSSSSSSLSLFKVIHLLWWRGQKQKPTERRNAISKDKLIAVSSRRRAYSPSPGGEKTCSSGNVTILPSL